MRIRNIIVALLATMLIFPASAHASESFDPLTLPDTEVTTVSLSDLSQGTEGEWSATAGINGSGLPKSGGPEISPMGGVADTWAPGGAGARVSMTVQGTGNIVNGVNLGYWAGFVTQGSNACVSDFEVSFYGAFNDRQVQNKSHYACVAPWSATNQWFTINQYLYSNTPICGRVKVNNQWSPHACLQIIP
ncbi:hypothetical protein [Corynebacterium sp. A21]|uniref:hypothetical protein n=1 Tax=Corynebacterium sp. A21 TaxID=3457318 RepID=UPI003FD29AF8